MAPSCPTASATAHSARDRVRQEMTPPRRLDAADGLSPRGDPCPGSMEWMAFQAIRRLAEARQDQLALRAGETDVLFPDDPHVLAYARRNQRSVPLLALANFSDDWQSVDAGLPATVGLSDPALVHSTLGRLDCADERLHLPPWGFAWLTDR